MARLALLLLVLAGCTALSAPSDELDHEVRRCGGPVVLTSCERVDGALRCRCARARGR